jgi:hypothetical protein
MANDPGPAPVPMSLARRVRTAGRRFTLAAALVCLAAPIFGEMQGDPAVAAQDALAECQRIFVACAQACFGDTCRVCEEERDICKAEVYSNTAPFTPRAPASWWEGFVFDPRIPGLPNWTPWKQRPKPVGQTPTDCSPESAAQILARDRRPPSEDVLSERLAQEYESLDEIIRNSRVAADTAETQRERDEASSRAAEAKLKQRMIEAARRVLDSLGPNTGGNDTRRALILLAIDLAVTKTLAGLDGRGTLARLSVGDEGAWAGIIRSGSMSYDEKLNALAHILMRYGAGWPLEDLVPDSNGEHPSDETLIREILELARATGLDIIVARCRANPMPVPGAGSGGEGTGPNGPECYGETYDTSTQCCIAEGIGTRVTKTAKTIWACSPDRRSPNPEHPSRRNGCGTDGMPAWVGDSPDNPCFDIMMDTTVDTKPPFLHIETPRFVYWGPSFLPACDFHDDCWGTCNTTQTGTSQSACDAEFGSRLEQICDASLPSGELRERCHFRARSYQRLVSVNIPVYQQSQAAACDCCEGATR